MPVGQNAQAGGSALLSADRAAGDRLKREAESGSEGGFRLSAQQRKRLIALTRSMTEAQGALESDAPTPEVHFNF